jgi:type IV pilus assembly protein PilQ
MQPGLILRLLLCLVLSAGLGTSSVAWSTASSRYTGQKISLDLHNAELGDVLRLIAEISGLNVIASPEVQGTVTMRLVEVPWDQALEAILKLHGLTQERQGNVILIAPRQQFITQQQERLRARQLEAQAEAVMTHIVPVKYRDAAELQATLQRQVGHCATISADTRTNTLIITGTPSCLGLR